MTVWACVLFWSVSSSQKTVEILNCYLRKITEVSQVVKTSCLCQLLQGSVEEGQQLPYVVSYLSKTAYVLETYLGKGGSPILLCLNMTQVGGSKPWRWW